MKFPKVLPAPWYRDPALDDRVAGAGFVITVRPAANEDVSPRPARDRYYTMCRRVQVRQAMPRRL